MIICGSHYLLANNKKNIYCHWSVAEDAQQVQGWTDQKSNYYISTGTASDGVDTVDIVCIVTDTIGTEIDGTSNDQGVQLKRRFHYTFWLETIPWLQSCNLWILGYWGEVEPVLVDTCNHLVWKHICVWMILLCVSWVFRSIQKTLTPINHLSSRFLMHIRWSWLYVM